MIQKTKSLFALSLIATLSILFIYSCGKNDSPPIEVGYVNFQIYPNSTEYLRLNNVGGYAYVSANKPSRGIIIYRMSIDEFKAYERTPTYKPDSCCIYYDNLAECTRLIVDESAFFALDTCVGTKYLLLDGSIIEGPGSRPLYKYNTRFDGETLFVYN